jgi:hypothetical protein
LGAAVTAPKSLKDQNRKALFAIVAANALALFSLAQVTSGEALSWSALLKLFTRLLSVGVACTLSTVLNGLLSADTKYKLVFWRRHDVLPAHRAFSQHAPADPRIDLARLEKVHGAPLPTEPKQQNATWYQMYKTVEDKPAVTQVHRDFLLLRDYTALSVLFIVPCAAVALWTVPLHPALVYIACLAAQYMTVRISARTYGIRFVTTVLAQKSAAKELAKKAKKGRKTGAE